MVCVLAFVLCVYVVHALYCAYAVCVIAQVSCPVIYLLCDVHVCCTWWLPRVNVDSVFDATHMVCGPIWLSVHTVRVHGV